MGKVKEAFYDILSFKEIEEAVGTFTAYHEQNEKNKAKFMKLFHKGVKVLHRGSKVTWEITDTYKHSSTGEVRCKIKSPTGKIKELRSDSYYTYEITYLPEAVRVLFGGPDEIS